MGKRRGFTLIEMVTAFTVGSMMAGIAVGVLYLLLHVERDSREHLRGRTTLSRLARCFRDDVHAANSLSVPEAMADGRKPTEAGARPVCRLHLPDSEVVEYRGRPGELLRTSRSGQKVQRRESFWLPRQVTVSVARSDGPFATVVSLRIVREGGPPDGPSFRPTEIEATLSKDHHLARLQEPQEK